jgi:hypothetical protein
MLELNNQSQTNLVDMTYNLKFEYHRQILDNQKEPAFSVRQPA